MKFEKIFIVSLTLLSLFLTSCARTNSQVYEKSQDSIYTNIDIYNNSNVGVRNRLYRQDGSYQDFENTYNTIAIKVKPGEKYLISGIALNEQFPFVLCAKEDSEDAWSRTVLFNSEPDLQGKVYSYAVTVPEGANTILVNTRKDSDIDICSVKQNLGVTVQPYTEYEEVESKDPKFDKAYFSFVLDDTNALTYQTYMIFHDYDVPLSCAAIMSSINDPVKEIDGKIKDVLDLVVQDGGEVLVHYTGNLADVGYKKDAIEYQTSEEDWFDRVVMPKVALEKIGYPVQGIMRADYTQANSVTGESYCKLLYKYSDAMGRSSQYSLKRTYMQDFQNIESFLKWIEDAKGTPGFYPIAFHGWEEILGNDMANLKIILENVLGDERCEVTTYREIYERFYKPY